jgi:hypothetical protein
VKNVYLCLAIVGAVVPYVFFVMFFLAHGIDVPVFLLALFSNGASAGFTADLLISSLVFWLFMFSQGESRAWIYILVNLTIGLSCALPLYLYVNERGKEGQAAA